MEGRKKGRDRGKERGGGKGGGAMKGKRGNEGQKAGGKGLKVPDPEF